MVKDLSNKFPVLRDSMGEQRSVINDSSHIASGTLIKGEITTDADIRIDGSIDGKINSKSKVVIGERSIVEGDISAGNVEFWGTINGDVYVRDVLSLKNTACVNGNIHTRKLQVELGAQLNGECHMRKESVSIPLQNEEAQPQEDL